MGDVGAPEVLIILVVILVLFGGAKLPELARSLGKAKKEFHQALEEGVADHDAPSNAAQTPAPRSNAAQTPAPRSDGPGNTAAETTAAETTAAETTEPGTSSADPAR